MDEPKAVPSPHDILWEAYQAALQKGEPRAIEATSTALFAHAAKNETIETAEGALCRQEAHRYEAVWEWDKAEAAFRHCVVLAHQKNDGGMVFKTNLELCGFYRFTGQTEQALKAAEEALALAQNSTMAPLIGIALEYRAFCLLEQKNTLRALQTAEALVQTLFASSPVHEPSDAQKGRALILRADCLTELNLLERAEQDLAIALPLLERLSGVASMAGVQKGLAHWWGVTARGAYLRLDFKGSADAWRTAVQYRRVVSQAEQLEGPYKFAALSRSLRKMGEALLLIGDTNGSSQALNESHDIQAVIKQPAAGFAL